MKQHLPVHFYSNTVAWVTGRFVSNYLMSKLAGALQEYCGEGNPSFKILRIVDNAPAPPPPKHTYTHTNTIKQK